MTHHNKDSPFQHPKSLMNCGATFLRPAVERPDPRPFMGTVLF